MKAFKHIVLVLVVLSALVTVNLVTPHKAFAATNGPVILVHGFNPDAAVNCNDNSTFGTIKSYFSNGVNGKGGFAPVTVGFYNGDDKKCDADLRWEYYRCTGWYDGNDGTVNEDLRHVSCMLAWFIWDNDTKYGITVQVVAHSMGGILIRQAMNDTPYEPANFPPYLLVTNAVTAGTPHQGLSWLSAAIACGRCLQIGQIEAANPLMSNMNSRGFRGGFARNPQARNGTDWTTMVSSYDDVLNQNPNPTPDTLNYPNTWDVTALNGLMPGATHFVVYAGGGYPAYTHGGYLTDTNSTSTAWERYSDNNGSYWYYAQGNSYYSIFTMYYAALYSSW